MTKNNNALIRLSVTLNILDSNPKTIDSYKGVKP